MGGCQRAGRVTKVGKKNGKDQNRCWVQEKDTESNFDFVNEVEHWRKLNKNVTFKEDSHKTSNTAVKDDEEIGILHSQNWHTLNESHEMEDQSEPSQGMDVHQSEPSQSMDFHKTFATEVPKKFHDHPSIILAKEEEMKRWKEYKTVQPVSKTEDMQVISSRWVVTQKEEGQFKARLVVRGFEEDVYPQSDSPTASRDSFKTFLALAANENLQIKNMDVKSAFLQGTP